MLRCAFRLVDLLRDTAHVLFCPVIPLGTLSISSDELLSAAQRRGLGNKLVVLRVVLVVSVAVNIEDGVD